MVARYIRIIVIVLHLNGHIFRVEIALTDGRLMGISRDMNVTADLNNALKRNLTALDKELKDFNKTFDPVHMDLENYLTAFAGKVLFLKCCL